jgi:hypothetical protein
MSQRLFFVAIYIFIYCMCVQLLHRLILFSLFLYDIMSVATDTFAFDQHMDFIIPLR